MEEIVQGLDDTHLIAAMDANFAEEMACFGRNLPGAELRDDHETLYFATPYDYNGVLRFQLQDQLPETVHKKIEDIQAYFRDRQSNIGWFVGPATQPAHLGDYLTAHDFIYRSTNIGMAIASKQIKAVTTLLPSLTIQEITDLELLQHWRTIAEQCWDNPESAYIYHDAYQYTGFGEGRPWHHYLGWQHGQPVAIASLLLHAGVAGIYGVATLPEARRQGIGAAMTRHVLQEAFACGYRVAVLSPSQMGLNIYQHIGFTTMCSFTFYTWSAE